VFWYKNTYFEAEKEEVKKGMSEVLIDFDMNNALKEVIFQVLFEESEYFLPIQIATVV